MTQKPGFIGYLHSFRGFAILNIVFIHAVVGALIAETGDLDMSNPIAIVNEVLFHDSTLYFAVISGLLFSAILERKGYTRFYINKLKYVLLPYFLITAIVTIFKSLAPDENDQSFLITYLTTLIRDFAYGKANPLFWYIPVLIFLYIVTPLLASIMKLKKVGLWLIFFVIIAPLFVSRVQMAFEYILSIQTMVYFTGSYAFGMLLGQNLDRALEWINKTSKIIWSVIVIITAILTYLYVYDIDMWNSISLRESAFYVQKIALSAVIILAFKRLGENQPKWLQVLARDSFGIYFIHGFAVFGSLPLFMFILSFDQIAPFHTIIGAVILTAFSIGISMLLILGFRKLFKKNSRMFIGS